jgi:hypothetical protein
MSTTGWVSTWATWEKSPEEGGRGTDKTDKTVPGAEKSSKEGGGGTAKTDKTPDGLVAVLPCAVCGGVVRWNDQGVLRCVACWPTPLTRKARAAERASSCSW